MKILEKIHKFLKESLELGEDDIRNLDSSSVYIAEEIAIYAHRNQYRENGEKYLTHPLHCLELYQHFVGITPDDPFCIDTDLMAKHRIPFDGVQEVCVLHDILEDTEITMEDIADIYSEFGLQTYFEMYIKKPLELITHDKNMPYPDYIAIVNKNRISAMVKMMDMVDNLNILGLCDLDDKKIKRSKNYLDYIKTINDKYHFLENIINYKYDFHKENGSENTLDTPVNEEYKKKIVAVANEYYKVIVGQEHKKDKDFIKYPHLFLLGCVMDSQIDAKKAWAIPNIIAEELGGKDFSLFCAKDLNWYREQFENKKLHRFNKEMSGAFYSAVIKIKEDYNGDASNIWNDEPSSAELVCRLLEFKKVGIKIATMAANILSRDYGVKLKDKCAIEISPDIHVKRTMYRLGLLPEQEKVDFKQIDANQVIYAAKSLNPEFPGVLDPVCWYVGNRKICTNDGCMSGINGQCPFADFCIRQK